VAISTINPTTGKTEANFQALTDEQIEAALGRTAAAAQTWARTTFEERAALMHRAADTLEADAEHVARLITVEMGKPIAASRAEVLKSATTMRFYADKAEDFLRDEELATPGDVNAKRAYARYEPLGTVLAVMPWNYPVWQVVRFAAPALMAGNTGVLKHASNVPQTALYLEELFVKAGFPDGAFVSLLISARQVEQVIRDPRIAAITLTGSEPAGRSVASIAGDEIKKTVLELGGADPFIVMPSADLEAAVKTAVTSRIANNGQACINAKRFIVHSDVYEAFLEHFTAKLAELTVGDPLDESTDLGPLATESGVDDIVDLVEDAREQGARIVLGGERPDREGWFYPATVVDRLPESARLFREEAFGPVASVFEVGSAQEAIALANDSEFGLGSAAWTTDEAEAETFIRELQAGTVNINGMTISYPQLPFGGIKRSGYGRELAGAGIREFCNLKTVWRG
jgi:succinate-semialdehyde dehydrogenase/glutarate-semialdehyde dehydrogenase